MSRTDNSVRNISYALIGQGVGVLISFISRIFFIKILGTEYLGINGLFSNILTILSLAELGIGEAITFSLYKPLAKKNNDECMMLMQFYKKVYTIICIAILILGLSIMPFLNLFIKEIPNIQNLNFIYVLFVLNTSVSYLFSYKRNLIIADQKRYIATFYRYLFYFILNCFQILFLITTKNYILFLILQVIFTLIENILISLKADKMYSFLKIKVKLPLDDKNKRLISKNTKAMMMHKIGGIVVNSTDNILLSKIVSLTAVGIYSNYYLILNALNIIIGQIYNSIIASIGNLCVDSNKDKELSVFEKVDFLGFWIYCFSSACLLCLLNPFISMWIGEKYVFDFFIVVLLVVIYYVTGMRKSVLIFREASGLFYYDRWKAIIEAIVNLIASIILGIKFGVFGIFLGTLVSTLMVCFWVEPLVLFKKEFNKNLKIYFKNYIKYFFITTAILLVSYLLCTLININTYTDFIIKFIISITIPNLFILIIFRKNKNYLELKMLLCGIISKYKNRINGRIKNKLKNFVKNNKIIYILYFYIFSTILKLFSKLIKPDDKSIMFVSYGGKKYDDSPKVMFEYIKCNKKYQNYTLNYAFIEPKKYSNLPDNNKVKIDTLSYYYKLFRSKYWISNSSVQRGLNFKDNRHINILFMHGLTALKKSQKNFKSKGSQFKMVKPEKFDLVFIEGKKERNLVLSNINVEPENLKNYGLPRIDELIKINNDTNLKKDIKNRLNIPVDKKIILYAPTYREYNKTIINGIEVKKSIDVKKWKKYFEKEYVLLLTSHYEINNKLEYNFDCDFIYDVSKYDSFNELLAIADILITDYSNIVFDNYIIEKPAFCFGYDYDEYTKKGRGFYTKLEDIYLDGVIKNEDVLIDKIKNLKIIKYKKFSKKVKEEFILNCGNSIEKCLNEVIKK